MGPARVEAVGALQGTREGFVTGIGVGNGEPAHGALGFLDHVHKTPVGDGRNRETRRRGEHGPVIGRGREERVGLSQEGETSLCGDGPRGAFAEEALLVALLASALERRAEYLGDLLQEQDFVLREQPSVPGVRAQDTVSVSADADRGA